MAGKKFVDHPPVDNIVANVLKIFKPHSTFQNCSTHYFIPVEPDRDRSGLVSTQDLAHFPTAMGSNSSTCANLPSCIPEVHVPMLNKDVVGISGLMRQLEHTMTALPQIDQLIVDMRDTVQWVRLCLLIITVITCFAVTMVALFAVCLCGYYTRKLRHYRVDLRKKFSEKYGDGSGHLKVPKNSGRIRRSSLYARTRLSTIAESVAVDGSAGNREVNLSD